MISWTTLGCLRSASNAASRSNADEESEESKNFFAATRAPAREKSRDYRRARQSHRVGQRPPPLPRWHRGCERCAVRAARRASRTRMLDLVHRAERSRAEPLMIAAHHPRELRRAQQQRRRQPPLPVCARAARPSTVLPALARVDVGRRFVRRGDVSRRRRRRRRHVAGRRGRLGDACARGRSVVIPPGGPKQMITTDDRAL